jgi:hypothetical protein
VAIGCALTPSAQAAGPAATAKAGGSAHSPASATARAATSYWTKQRMRSAIPVPVPKLDAAAAAKLRPTGPQGRAGKVAPAAPRLAGGAALAPLADPGASAASWAGSVWSPPATTSGKVFFVGSDGLNYVCSGSAINSNSKNVVFTAGHCVGRFGKWFNVQPWIFVPGYNNGNAPFGQWSAQQLWTRSAWFYNDNRAEDIGAAVMNTNASGQHIVNVVGGQGIEWNYPLAQYQFQFGYPTVAPFNGQLLKYCTGNSFNDGGHNGIYCNMTEGASGGPWLDDFDGTFGWLDSVNSWVFWNSAGVRFKWNGPYFGNNAADLYNTVANL